MNKTRFLTIGVIALLVINAITLFILFHMHLQRGQGPHHEQGPANYIIQQLKFDEKQQQQFGDLRKEHHDSLQNIHEQEKKLHDEYFDLLKTDHPDKAKVDSIAALMAEHHKQIETFTFEHFQKLRAICREDQKKLFDATIDDIARMVMQQGPRPPH